MTKEDSNKALRDLIREMSQYDMGEDQLQPENTELIAGLYLKDKTVLVGYKRMVTPLPQVRKKRRFPAGIPTDALDAEDEEE